MIKILYYLGNDYYNHSNTEVGVLYEVYNNDLSFIRWDWGKLGLGLEQGEEYSLRPAPEWIHQWARKKCEAYI